MVKVGKEISYQSKKRCLLYLYFGKVSIELIIIELWNEVFVNKQIKIACLNVQLCGEKTVVGTFDFSF